VRPFADSVLAYHAAGWPCIIPVPPGKDKAPPPDGFTGEAGRDTDPGTLAYWAQTVDDYAVALRMPDGVIGIDVDHYLKGEVDKRGGDILTECVSRWGPLPATWRSSARELPSGIRFYRVPPGRYAAHLGNAIEIIQRHHRYAVVWPSWHAEVGKIYQWTDPFGRAVYERPAGSAIPRPQDLPELPVAWVEGLREGASVAGPAAAPTGVGAALRAQLEADNRPPCAEITSAARVAISELQGQNVGGRHDTALPRTYQLVQLAASGHPGVGPVLEILRAVWLQVKPEDGGREWDRLILGAARKAVTLVGARQVDRDPCFAVGTILIPAPRAGNDGPEPGPGDGGAEPSTGSGELGPIEAPEELHPFEFIGAGEFNPRAGLDQTLAAEVLARTQPVLRYAYDSGEWLLRGRIVWSTRPDLGEWAVALLADRMPIGDPSAEKGSDAREAAERRKRFMTAGTAGAVARKMKALTAGGVHPSALRMADMDREPWLLWAGGVAWDLRRSGSVPCPAEVDPATPHLRSAGTLPDVRPTPLWDAFLAAVWPDPELRAWAMRVLAITVTGHADKALPILLGDKDRGKTQVVVLIMSVLGSYAHSADPRLLGAADRAHASIIHALMGRRLSFIDEGPRDSRAGQEQLKQLTGGGPLTGNAMHKDPVTFIPTHTLVLTANDEPTLTDPAVRARVRLIPCDGDPEQIIAARAAIGHPNSHAWRTEAPGVLARLMAEAAAWLADPSSAHTSAAPSAYRFRGEDIAAEQDPIAAWLEEETEPNEMGERSRVLYEAFAAYARVGKPAGWQAPNETKWGKELTRRGFTTRHTRAGKIRPLRLRLRGWLPTSETTPPVVALTTIVPAENRDGLPPSGDGLVTGSNTDPSRQYSPLGAPISGTGDGCDGLSGCFNVYTHTHTQTHAPARTRAHTHVKHPDNPSHPSLSAKTRHQPVTNPSSPVTARRTGTKTTERNEVKVAARQAAAGDPVTLPAVVDRDGVIRELTALDAGRVLGAIIRQTGALTVDVETSGYPVGHVLHVLRTVQLGNEYQAVVLDPADPLQAEVARDALTAAPKLHAHSATADLVPLVAAGLTDETAWERMFDTVIPAKLADPASTGSDPGLKQLSGAVLGEAVVAPGADAARAALFKVNGWLTDTEVTTPPERSGWAQVPCCATMVRYAASDVLDTAALARVLAGLPAELGDRERAAQRITARVAHRGLALDREHIARLTAEHTPALAAATQRLAELGIDNPGSDRQLAAKLTEMGVVLPYTQPSKKFPDGQPSVAAGVLEALDRGPSGLSEAARTLVDAVLVYRHHETVLTTFLGPYSALVDHGDGRARPTIYTLGTDTGRMSCVRPNMQQLPREGGIRAIITADPGHVLISADFSGVEIRVMAALSQDPTLLQLLRDGGDLHSIIAAQVFGPEFTKADRYMVKRGVFGWAYGGSVPTLAKQVGVSESIMSSVVDNLAMIAPAYVQWANAVKQAVRRGSVQMPTYAGRVIHLPRQFPHKAPNYCIQGTARELLVDALLAWDATPWGRGVVLPVHDEIVAMVPEYDADRALATLVTCMTTELYGVAIVAEPGKPSFAWRDSS
jgi:hypothetical protein